jgi:hypothetical protein
VNALVVFSNRYARGQGGQKCRRKRKKSAYFGCRGVGHWLKANLTAFLQ